ncbi:MAG: hypothetical protein RM347_013075 [Nostoc sp. ChiQUE02]|uniref:WD40 domain-containing protein n=1 Tax=Nostoc sp. ChiQUE02 TaxID=3075377 RepID=UPI003A0FD3AB
MGEIDEAVNTLEKAINESQSQYNPLLYIHILEDLHSLYFEQKQYEQAFHLKQKQREIESQYGFRAFIGAGRLQPRRQVINPENSPNQPSKDIVEEVVAAFGRQQDIQSLLHRIGRTDCKLTVIYGQSGVGKSSIVQAGLLPVLKLTPFDGLETLPILVQVYTAWEKECGRLVVEKLEEVRGLRLSEPVETSAAIIEQLRQNENRNLLTVLIFDQFEEFFFAYKDQANRRPFYDFLRNCLNISYVKVILSLRQDYLHYLLEWSRTTKLPIIDDDILHKNILYYLGNFTPAVAKTVIQSFTENSQFYLAPDLIDALVEDLASELREVRPIELQVIGAQLQTEKITTLRQYRKNWLKEKLVERFLEEVVKDCGLENERAAQLVLYLLTNENNTRPLKTRAELEKDLGTEAQNLDLVLQILVGSGLVFRVLETPADRYQLVHDYLVPFIRQQRSAELLAKIKEAEEEKQLMQAELNRVLQKQLKDARRTGIGLAGLAALASGFAIASFLALISGNNSELNAMSAVSSGRLAAYQDMEALIQAIKAGKQLKSWWKIGIKDNTKKQVVAALQSASYGIRESNTLEGHSAAVNIVSFSPDDKLIASGSDDKTIRLWKPDGSQAITKPLQHTKSVTSLSFSPDSNMLASGTQDGVVRLWNIHGKLIKEFNNSQSIKASRETSFDSKKNTLGSVNTSQQNQNNEGKSSTDTDDKNKSITSIVFSHDKQMIASISKDGILKIWKINGELIKEFKDTESEITNVSFSRDQKKIISVNYNYINNTNIVKMWEIYTKNTKYIKSIKFNRDIIGVVLSNDGKIINSLGNYNLKLWHSNSNARENILLFLENNQKFSPKSNIFAAFSISDTSISLSSVNSLDNNYIFLESLIGHTQNITSISLSLNGKMLASGSEDNTVKLWNIESRDFKPFDDSEAQSVSFSPNGHIIASISNNNRVQFWQHNHNKSLLATLPGSNSAVSFSKFDHTLVASASQDKTVQLWRQNGKFLSTLRGEVIDGSFSSDGKTIALISNDDYSVSLFGNDGQRISNLKGHKGRVYKICFSQDGQTIATASQDKSIKLWKRDGTLLKKLEGYNIPINSMSLSPNGQNIVILDVDNTVKFLRWDGKLIKTLQGQGSSLIKINFIPDGEIVAISNLYDDKNKIQLWKSNGTFFPMIQKNKNESIKNIFFSSDNQTIGVQYEKNIQLWRRNGTLIKTVVNLNNIYRKENDQKLYKMVFSSDNQTIGLEYENYIQVWKSNGTLIQTVKTSNSIYKVDSQILITFGSDKKVRVWQNGKLIRTIFEKNDFNKNEINNNEKIIFDGNTLAIIKDETEVQLKTIDAKSIKKLLRVRQKSIMNRISKINFVPKSDILAISGDNDTIKLWKIQNNTDVATQLLDPFKIDPIKRHSDEITSVSISPDGKTIASTSKDKTLKLWEKDGTFIKTIPEADEVNSVSFSPNSDIIASASDKAIKLLRRRDGTLIKSLEGHSNKVNRIIFSHNGQTIVSASEDQTVRLWKLDGSFIKSLKESYPVTNISFSRDDKMIASATRETIKLWSVDDGEVLSTYQRLGKGDVNFSPDGNSIAAAGNNAVAMWDFDLDKLLNKSCKLVRNYLKNNRSVNDSDRQLCDDILNRK